MKSYPPDPSPGSLRRVGFSIRLDDDGQIHMKGGSEYLRLLLSGMFGMEGSEVVMRVTSVWLLYDSVNDEVVPLCQQFKNLRKLRLTGTRCTDGCVEQLRGLDKLEAISIDDTSFTDNCLLHLAMLTHLKQIDIANTLITEDGIARLRQMTPELVVNFQPPLEL